MQKEGKKLSRSDLGEGEWYDCLCRLLLSLLLGSTSMRKHPRVRWMWIVG